ncbi:ATP-binding protein [Chitinolyticbacter meiyuanensis]|uniref:ATP-binding protein n=1 Tax=Chitinolyticbacter meiyuanensis TaxID=682798 RepID=UPI0011E5ED59|nr:ATP-binding protein [Chitinolyticbacter meiyuanensis]
MSDKQNESRQAHCETHGDYTSTFFAMPFSGSGIWSKCPECSREHAEKQERDRLEAEERDRRRRWEAKIQHAAIPDRFQDRTLANYVVECDGQRHALEFATAFASAFEQGRSSRCAIFSGEAGTGKTHLAVGIALRIMHRYNRSAAFTTVQRYIRAVRDTWSRDSELSESEVVRHYAEPDLLILDEVGVQAGSENEKLILFDLLNERYEKRKSTLMLTNLTVDECRAFLGERVFDRLREDGGEFVPFTWESQRGKKAA